MRRAVTSVPRGSFPSEPHTVTAPRIVQSASPAALLERTITHEVDGGATSPEDRFGASETRTSKRPLIQTGLLIIGYPPTREGSKTTQEAVVRLENGTSFERLMDPPSAFDNSSPFGSRSSHFGSPVQE